MILFFTYTISIGIVSWWVFIKKAEDEVTPIKLTWLLICSPLVSITTLIIMAGLKVGGFFKRIASLPFWYRDVVTGRDTREPAEKRPNS